MSTLPLVSIGLPVYNGLPHLRPAIESLLKQSYANVEIIISDNASTDGTGEYCQALAQVYPQVRYFRNETNVGPAVNFRLVVELARGEYFMWAADDDRWSEHFVQSLVDGLQAKPEAVLATPMVLHMAENGMLRSETPDRPADGESKMSNLKRLYDDHAATWIYGVWQTAWLRRHLHEYFAFPYWGADILWLADVCLRFSVTGNQEAVIFKRLRRSAFAPRSSRAAVSFWLYMFWHLSRMCVRRTDTWGESTRALAISWQYVYRLCIRRPHLIRTAWRVLRMVSVATITSIPVAVAHSWRWATRPLPTRVL